MPDAQLAQVATDSVRIDKEFGVQHRNDLVYKAQPLPKRRLDPQLLL